MMQWILLGAAVLCSLFSAAFANEDHDFAAVVLAAAGMILGCAAASITAY